MGFEGKENEGGEEDGKEIDLADQLEFFSKYGFVSEGGLNYQQMYAYYLFQYPTYVIYPQRISTLKMLIILAHPYTQDKSGKSIEVPKPKTGVEYKRDYFKNEFGLSNISMSDSRLLRESDSIDSFRRECYQMELEDTLSRVLDVLCEQGVISVALASSGRTVMAKQGGGGRPR